MHEGCIEQCGAVLEEGGKRNATAELLNFEYCVSCLLFLR